MGTEPIVDTHDDLSDDTASDQPTAETTADPSKDRNWAITITVMAALVVGALLVTQMLLLSSLNEAKTDIASLQSQISEVDESVQDLSDEVGDVAETVNEVATAPPPSGSASGADAPTAASLPDGYLPRFDRNQPDAARGMTLGEVAGIDGYTEELVSVDPADGTRRIWMVWAHWCPFCQQEMPLLSDWYPTVADEYETELVTVSTNIDPSRGNPLPAYLADQQFPFPVVVDANSQLAVQMGVSAFPFWLITDGDGEVLLRTTGLLQVEQIQDLLDQVENLEA